MSDNYVKTKHDIGVTNTNGDVVGLMLAQKPDGTPAYAVFDRKHLADQFFTGTPLQTYQDPEVEIPLSQYSWRAGMGLKVFDPSEPERYCRAKNLDLRHRGKVISGYQPSIVSRPQNSSTPTIIDANMELQTGWNWADDDVHQTNIVGHDSVNSLVLNVYKEVLNVDQYIAGWTPGVTYQINVWTSCTDAAARANVFIDDGISSVRVDAVNNDWTKLAATKTIDHSAKYMKVRLKSPGGLEITYFDEATVRVVNTTNAVVEPLTAIPRRFKNFANKLWCGLNNYATILNDTEDELQVVFQLNTNITDLEIFSDDRLYLAQNTAPYQYIDSDYTYTGIVVSNAAKNSFEFFKTVHGVSPTLYGSTVNGYQLRSSTAPINAANASLVWTDPPTTVGSSYHRFNKLLYLGGTLYMQKEDKPYYLDSSGDVQDDLASEFENLENPQAGRGSLAWDGKLYLTSTSHLREIDGSVKTWLSPSKFITDLPEYGRDIQSLAGDEEWLYGTVGGNTVNLEVLAGRYEVVGGATDWRWHPQRTLDMTNCETSFVSSIPSRKLWVAPTNGDDPIYSIPLPDSYGNIENDANRNFDSGGYFHTPRLHGDFRLTQKAYTKLELELGHDFDTDIYFEAHYNTLNNSIWTAIGDFKGNSDTRIATGYLPLTPTDTMLQLNFVANTDDNQKTPSLIGYNLAAILYPPRRKIIACTVRAAQGVQTKDVLSSKYESIVSALDNARDATWPIKVFDIHGDPINVKFLPLPSGTPWISLYKDEKTRTTELRYNLMLQEADIG